MNEQEFTAVAEAQAAYLNNVLGPVLALVLTIGVLSALLSKAREIQLDPEGWLCTARHEERRPIQTPYGAAFEVVYACDQWSRR